MKTKRFLLIVVSTLCMMVVGCSRNSGEDIPNGGQNEPNIETTPSDSLSGNNKEATPPDSLGGNNEETTPPDSSIIGTWELKTICYSECDYELPLAERDLFIFSSEGQVKVIKKTSTILQEFPNEDGEYDYSYDKEKKIIHFLGKDRYCIISDGRMRIEGYHSPDDGLEMNEYIFIKKQI